MANFYQLLGQLLFIIFANYMFIHFELNWPEK